MELEDLVTLVDESGAVIGQEEKLAAHEAPGKLHLAFSVFVYRPDGATLLQCRAAGKYHFPLVWTNACCSHPRPGEDVLVAARRRLVEELGLRVLPRPAGTFVYRAVDPASGLVEHEYDHVLVATTVDEARPDPVEVAALAWVAPEALLAGETGYELTPWCLPALRIAEQARARP
ncbi:MAG TPA: isopentenyl-diphosphate Delta-isomerase [Acidimicrobiales bacterium]|nr:isopentenyl-diphosphate Delta-isomerase [Acidimicrobiales bacterium]